MLNWRLWLGVCGVCSAVQSSTASATPLPTFYQGRTLGMGGSSLAFSDDATAAAINPANLDAIDEWSATGTFAPMLIANSAPFSPGGHTQGEREVAPLMFVGAGVRIFDKAVTGLAVYAESGAGARYLAVPELGGMDMAFQLAVMEAALPLSYAITDEFSLGLALRMGFATMATDMPFDPGTGPMRVDESMSGFGFPGVSVGANYRPTDQLSLAVNYRSKMTMEISGDGTASSPAFGSQTLAVESEWSTPHSFGIGAAYEIVPKRLLVATDLRYALLDDAVDDLNMTIEMQGQAAPIQSALSLQWKDSLVWALGAEYRVTDWMPLRAGYGLTTSATAEDHATALTPAPGLLQSLHAGRRNRAHRAPVRPRRRIRLWQLGGSEHGQRADGHLRHRLLHVRAVGHLPP